MVKLTMQSLLLLQQVAHTVANGLLKGFKLCQHGTNAVMCQEVMLKHSNTLVE